MLTNPVGTAKTGLRKLLHRGRDDTPTIPDPPTRQTTTEVEPGYSEYDYGLSQIDPSIALTTEYNITIPVRDGAQLQADLYRPAEGSHPVIVAMAPYPRRLTRQPGLEDKGGVGDTFRRFEQANPEFWIPRGYAYLSVSPRGFYGSEGEPAVLNAQEARDYYDAIEWAGTQDWSDGNVGLYGISYYAFSQYRVAAMSPPHLKAIVPWEGLSDPYREVTYRGGIPAFFGTLFGAGLDLVKSAPFRDDSFLTLIRDNPLINDALDDMLDIPIDEITVPMLSVAGLNDPDLHLRGNVEAFAASPGAHKKLHLYTGTHWGSAYQPWAHRLVLRFFDHWLKGNDTGLYDEPAIDFEVRTGPGSFTHAYGDVWPLPQTQWQRLHLAADDQSLDPDPSPAQAAVTARLERDAGLSHRVTFRSAPLPTDVAVAGPVCARLWVSADATDVDLTVELRDFDEAGNETRFAYAVHEAPDQPVTRGWLRVSHRDLDDERSTHYRPFHSHTRLDPMTPGVPVAVEVELWPTSNVFKAGHQIALTIHAGRYLRSPEARSRPTRFRKGKMPVAMYQGLTMRSPATTLHTGDGFDSWLQLPVITDRSQGRQRIAISGGGAEPASVAPPLRPTTFEPSTVAGRMGDTFEWSNTAPGHHGVVETTFGLFDAQLLRGTASFNPETWSTSIDVAGCFTYVDRVDGATGTIEIPPMLSDAADRSPIVVLSAGELPDGATFDLQVNSAAGDGWIDAIAGHGLATVDVDELPGTSTQLRCRLTVGGTTGEWSPPCDLRPVPPAG